MRNQTNLILNYMKEFGSISTLDAFRDLGVTRLSGRIFDLKEMGYTISSKFVSSKNRYGEIVHFKQYSLEQWKGDIMNDESKTNFLEIGRGAMLERFDYELDRIVDNIIDPNTPATKPRKIQMTITLTPDAERKHIRHEVIVKSTPQPTNPIIGATAIISGNGNVSLVELVTQIPGQYDVYGSEQQPPDVVRLHKQA